MAGSDRPPGRLRAILTCLGATILFSIAVWIWLPAPHERLLALSVAAPELSQWLFALSVLVACLAASDARRHPVARLALAILIASALLAARPLAGFAAVAERATADLETAFGRNAIPAVPDAIRRHMRARPLVVGDLFRGIPADDAPAAIRVAFMPSEVPLAIDVYKPQVAGKHPTIVQIHGGAWQRGGAGDDAIAATYFAAQGYVVFAIEYRLAPQDRWPAQLDDVRAAIAWVRSHGPEYGADPSRLAIVGRSAGAQLALVAAYAPGAPAPKAVVSYYGPTDLIEGYRDVPRPDPLHVRALLEAYLGGTPETAPEAYRAASPVTYAIRPLPATLIVAGGRDHIVLPRFGAELHARLRASGTPSVLVEIPWADHAFDAVPFGPSAQLALYCTERFLASALR